MSDEAKGAVYNVRFLPDDITVQAPEGENLLRLAMEHDIHVDANCGGARVCGKCRVKVKGEIERVKPKKSPGELPAGTELACCTLVKGDLEVEVPEANRVTGTLPSRSKGTSRVKLTGIDVDKVMEEHGIDPMIKKFTVDVPQATQEANAPDLERLISALRKDKGFEELDVTYSAMQHLPAAVRDADGKATATIMTRGASATNPKGGAPLVIEVEAGDTTDQAYGVAFDIGTTSVWAQLIDLNTGKVLADAADYNAQSRFGADVINRILACREGKVGGGIAKVQGAVVETMNSLLAKIAESSGIPSEKVSYLVIAGNTTMTHILLALDPKHIQMAPHVPVSRFTPPIIAKKLGLNVADYAYLYAFPSVSAWVGGDIVSGTLVSGFAKQEKFTLFIDLGTNGEIVLGNQDFLLSASCSAGPAFEGGEIRHGMRAMNGAIEDFHLNGPDAEPMILTIGQTPARGICGSGLINTIAGLFLAGVLQPDGKYIRPENHPRLREGEEGWEYVLVFAENSDIEQDIVLTEVDVENLFRAKSAVFAGIRTLLMNSGMELEMIEQVLIAGSFGQSLDIERAITIGLLPDLPLERFKFIGNGSLMGARLALQSMPAMEEGSEVGRLMTYIDLGAENTFMDEYMAGMFLPHTNKQFFPSIAAITD